MEKYIPRNITSKRYNVVNTFCTADYRSYSNQALYYGGSWTPGNLERDGRTILPNVPLRAEATLLAEMLRKGTHLSGGRKLKVRDKVDPLARSRMYRIDDMFNMLKSHKKGALLGVEIEYYPKRNARREYENLPSESPLCDVVSDGSLNDGGREIRRMTWANSEGRLSGLLSLKLSGKVDRSCGLHVHVDARHIASSETEFGPVETYERAIGFYKHIKYLVPRSRRRNHFCAWRNNCRNSAGYNQGSRYAALNYYSYEEHGTFEFRCQGGTLNTVKIESWALLCQWMVNFAKVRANTIPVTWKQFIAVLPEPLRSWAILRREKLYGTPLVLNDRTMSACAD